MKVMLRLLGMLFVLLLSTASVFANAADYPSRPVRLFVAFPPGGINDIVARQLAQKMALSLGKPVIVENHPGAGGTIGANLVAKSAPDGYTLLLGSVSNISMATAIYRHLPYNPTKDFTPISEVAASPNILVANPAVPVHTVKDVIQLAKSKKGHLNYASAGIGTSNHLTAEMFDQMAGVHMNHVPYRGDSPAVEDVLGGRVPVMFVALPVVTSLIKTGKLRAIAISSPKRSPLLPRVPTVAESGLPGFACTVWVGVLGPKGLPQSVMSKLNSAIMKATASRDFRAKLANLGIETIGSTPQQFSALIRSDTAKWMKVARTAKIPQQ